MEVKVGYKQTDVGVVPEDWEVKPIGDFFLISVGRDLKEENYSTSHDDVFKYPVFSNTVSNQGLFGFYNFPEYNGESLTIVGRGVGLGTAFKRSGGFGAIGRLLVLFPKANVNAAFVSEYINHRVKIFTESGGIPQLTGISISKYRIPIPPTFAEQEAITEALSDADALIEALEQLIAKKHQVKQGVKKELLTGKRRLPGFSGEWNAKVLKTITQVPITDGPHLTPRFLDNGIPFLSVNNLVDNKIDLTDLRHISFEDHLIFSRKCKPQRNDILFGKAASVGKVAIVEMDLEFDIWSPIALIRINKDHNPKFVYYMLQTKDVIRQIEILTNSSSQGNISMGEIGKLILPFPTKTEQTAIAEILSGMDAEVTALEGKLSKARQVKQGMMSELLTGRVRLV